MERKILKILQIEDNPGDIRLVCEMLKDIKQFDVICDASCTLGDGLERIQKNSYDVLLLDLGLSESFGIETLHKVLSIPCDLPVVIVMTIMDDEKTGIQAVKEGAQDYLIKGELNPHLLSRSIQYAIERDEAKRKLEEQIELRTAELRKTTESLKAEIEERKRTELKLIAAKEEAERASRAKTEFLTIMNHELRTPLNGILGFSKILLKTSPNEKQEDYIRTIISSANNLFNIITEILDMVQIKTEPYAHETKQTDIHLFCKDILSEAQNLNTKDLPILECISPDCPRFILLDDIKIKKVLMHLLSNAIKFTETGQVTLTVEMLNLFEETYEVEIRFMVSDTGIGMKEKDKEQIFNAFRQLDMSSTRIHGGIGMGLCIVKYILEKTGSSLKYQSTFGVGSQFYFDLILSYCE